METENKDYLELKLEWVKMRLNVMDQIEARLDEMKRIAILASNNDFSESERKRLNVRLRTLENEINELDKKSKALWLDCQ